MIPTCKRPTDPSSFPTTDHRLRPPTPTGLALAAYLSLAVAAALIAGCGGASNQQPAALGEDSAELEQLARRAALHEQASTIGYDAELCYELGASYWESGQLDSSRVYLEQAVLIDPYHVPSLTWLSRLYYEEGEIAEGILLLDPVVTSMEHPPAEILANMAVLRLAWGDIDHAIEHLLSCQHHHPGYAPAYGNLGYIYLQLGDLESAAGELRAAILHDATVPEFHNNLGIVYRRTDRFEQAANAFKRAIDIDPHFLEAHHNLALLYKVYLNDEDRARRHFRNFLALGGDPGDDVTQLFRRAEESP
jgi:tetratricopeptide (TPR) repeat protein